MKMPYRKIQCKVRTKKTKENFTRYNFNYTVSLCDADFESLTIILLELTELLKEMYLQ